jgi:hypothetical protein
LGYWWLSGGYILGRETSIDYIGMLGDNQLVVGEDGKLVVDRGIMVRDQAWEFPEEFKGIDISVPYLYFPEQIEEWEDVVMATNFFIIPRMRFTCFTPEILFIEKFFMNRPVWRYETLYDVMDKCYGHIDFDVARDLADFLNPNSVFGNLGYYESGDIEIEGHHAIIDNQNLIMEALFGYYGPDPENKTPWAKIDLKPFVDWAYGPEE